MMYPTVKISSEKKGIAHKSVILLGHKTAIDSLPLLNSEEKQALKEKVEAEKDQVTFNSSDTWRYISLSNPDDATEKEMEKSRKAGAKAWKQIEEEQKNKIDIISTLDKKQTLAFVEGLLLASYRFDKYKSSKKEGAQTVINLIDDKLKQIDIDNLNHIIKGVWMTRELVNEPVNTLDSVAFSQRVATLGQEYGFKVKTLHKQEIEDEKMGGLLGVNAGSITPPTFTILEWKHESYTSRPIVIIGKGVMFDTGGINLKTPAGSLDEMKCDMAGAAAVVGTFMAVAALNLPIHIVGLIPATDNRLNNNALVPGDIITMHNGTTVEILNTDAEGRLILADAISYADRYNPWLIIELSTLTGSTVMTLGNQGMAAMGTVSDKVFDQLEKAGYTTHERLVRFPFWDEYGELIKSEVADLKNIGGREAGAITAGKFLSHFAKQPFIHLDIAGVAFTSKENNYHSVGGTGTGVRLLVEFLQNQVE